MVAPGTVHEPLPARDVMLGRGTSARRLLPNKARRMVGPWCFVDHYGPDDVQRTGGLWLPPHPYAGLQVLTWLFEGLVEHTDSLGNRQRLGPGQLNLLTSGSGVCRAEVSPSDAPPTLHGVQLWVALPDAARTDTAPSFTHLAEPPSYSEQGARLRVLVGALAGETSPAPTHSPLVGAEITLEPGARAVLPLEQGFEHAVLVARGETVVAGEVVGRDEMVYLGSGRDGLELAAPDDLTGPAVVLLLGGEPFTEELVLWWNFLARDHDEVVGRREAWNDADPAPAPYGDVPGFGGERMAAPPMPPVRLRPRAAGS